MRTLVLPVEVEPLEEGGFLVVCEEIQGCLAEGDSVEEALENIEDVARVLLEFRQELGLIIPRGFEDFASAALKASVQTA